MKRAFVLTALFFGYLWFHRFMGGITLNHFLFGSLILALYFGHRATRYFLVLASPLLLKEMLYDSLRYIPFDWLQPIHVKDLHDWDLSLFGIACGTGPAVQGIHECLLKFSHPFFDAVFGALYHTLMPVMFVILLVLWKLKNDETAARYAAAFLAMNLLAFLTYIFFPAAAPWYVAQYGFAPPLHPMAGNPAGLVHFDSLIGMDLSFRIYSMNPVVFGAVPSMHAGFTMLGALYAYKAGKPFGFFMAVYTLVMWVAALYLQHHYFIDLVWGMAYALAVFGLMEGWLLSRVNRGYRRLLPFLLDAKNPVEAGEEVVLEGEK
ncbi:MAG: inositol phosphorylceramide synthase [Deltaproteobacteria bacterium]|nr:inositol phosphorylceramide synthase [Deltaproteobacteria bacterium]